MTDVEPGQSLTAKAVAFDGPGGVEVVRVIDREVPPPVEGQVRIAVRAAAINPTDILLRQMGSADQPPPTVPGVDAAGIVESAGPGVSRLSAGQKVVAVVKAHRSAGGAQSQYIVVPEASVAPMPDGFSFAQACTFSMNGLTALRSLELADLREGQSLAISGGAGLLAQYASVIAKERGLRIIADAKPEEAETVRSYGADMVVDRGPGFAEAVRRAFPDGVDALLDTAVLEVKAFPAIRDGGVYLPVRRWRERPEERGLIVKPVLVYDVFERTEWLEELRRLIETGKIDPRVAGEYTPEQTGAAHAIQGAGGVRGRLVILF